MDQNSRYAYPSRSDDRRLYDRDGIQSSRPGTNMQEKIVEDITSNIMGILDSRLKTLVDETAPQIRVAVRQALGDRDRAPSQPSWNPVGYTPPDMPQASLVPKKTLAEKSASKAKNIAVAVVCSLKPRPSARHPQLAGTLTKQDRTPRRFDSSTTATSPSEIRPQSSRSVSIVKIEESSDEGCFRENNSDGDDDFDMKESSDSDDERSASDDGGSASDSDYIDVADHVDNAVNERSARSTRTAKTLAGASRSGSKSDCEKGQVQVNTTPPQHRQPARSSLSTVSYGGRLAGESRRAARTCDSSAGSSRKRAHEDKEPTFIHPSECPLRKKPLLNKGKC